MHKLAPALNLAAVLGCLYGFQVADNGLAAIIWFLVVGSMALHLDKKDL
jgi:hypothetical protein